MTKSEMKLITDCVYRFISPSGKSYIGITNNLFKRFENHRKEHVKRKTKFYDALKKYGFENFKLEVLDKNIENIICLKAREKYFIELYDSLENGYNMTEGGDGARLVGEANGMFGRNHTEESKKKMSENCVRRFGETNHNHISNTTEEKRKEAGRKTAETAKNNFDKLTKEEQETIRLERSERTKETWKNRSDESKEKSLNSLRYYSYKSPEELEAINEKKKHIGESNGRATFYHLISPKGDEFLVSMKDGLNIFCEENDLILNVFYKYKNKDTIPEPHKSDTKMYNDEEYKRKRLNSIGWKVNHLRRIKI